MAIEKMFAGFKIEVASEQKAFKKMIEKSSERVQAAEEALREVIDEKEHKLLIKIDEIKFMQDKLTEQIKNIDGEGSSAIASNRVVQQVQAQAIELN